MHPDSQTARWYLIQTRPGQVTRAVDNLRNQQYICYSPRITVQKIRRGRLTDVSEPMFPNYLFIRLRQWGDEWAPIRSTRGVLRLVSFGGEPAPVADEIILAIHARTETPIDTPPPFAPGDRLKITAGPFKGLESIFASFDGTERVVLLLDILQKQTRLKIDLRHVEPAL